MTPPHTPAVPSNPAPTPSPAPAQSREGQAQEAIDLRFAISRGITVWCRNYDSAVLNRVSLTDLQTDIFAEVSKLAPPAPTPPPEAGGEDQERQAARLFETVSQLPWSVISHEGKAEWLRVRDEAVRLFTPPSPAPLTVEELRAAWEAGITLARSYGDNIIHLEGEQKERQWQAFLDRALPKEPRE